MRKLPTNMRYKSGRYWYIARQSRPHPSGHGRIRTEKWHSLGKTWFEARREYWEIVGGQTHSGRSIIDMLNRFESDCLPGLKTATQRDYAQRLGTLRKYFTEFTDVRQIRPRHAYDYHDLRGGITSSRRDIAVLSSALSHAVQWGWLDRNPFIGLRFKIKKPAKRVPTLEAMNAVIAVADDQIRALMRLGYVTALRKSDLLALPFPKLDCDSLPITISKTGSEVEFRGDAVMAAVAEARAARRSVVGPNLTRYLFGRRDGGRWTLQGFDSIFKRLVKKAGVDFQFHDLRRLRLTEFQAEHGSDAARALADHSSVTTTERYISASSRTVIEV